ncbi:MAG: sigma-54 dependent transcriptional regulator [Desulfobacterales bacterium]|nr:sigma-54 dependent transcriptional regulator [Desulfobacterales bacterium]
MMGVPADTSDIELLEMMARICHSIAYESPSKSDPKTGGAGKRETNIETLFALTDKGRSSEEISSLAESFGLMLVKLETREMRQEELIATLKKQNTELEAARKRLGEQNKSLKDSLREKYQPARFVGQCPEMQSVKQLALNIALRPINTLILGASGTGKEVFAKMIHFNSPRADKPFVAINCTAIPDSLFESEMFGINKGVATGVTQRKGIFEQAHTGTVFLDEIGDMSLPNQAKLLRVLEEQEVLPVGGAKPVKIDVKVISATNANLKEDVKSGKFREDLYYRLNVVEMTLPLLKDRGDDILILAEKLLAKNCIDLGRTPISLSTGARQCLLSYDWPGNVRELNNEMERAAALTLTERVEPEDLSAKLNTLGPADGKKAEGSKEPPASDTASAAAPERKSLLDDRQNLNLDRLKHQAVLIALDVTGGNKTKAAGLLGITREGLRKHLLKTKK